MVHIHMSVDMAQAHYSVSWFLQYSTFKPLSLLRIPSESLPFQDTMSIHGENWDGIAPPGTVFILCGTFRPFLLRIAVY